MNDRPVSAAPDAQARARKAGLAMLGVFGLATLFCFCGGAGVVGVQGYQSESAGVDAMYVAAGPMLASIVGLIAAVIGHFAITESLPAKVATPLVASALAGPCGLGCIIVFFEAIWPAL